jgi:transcriptional regulator with XRE-family HTH domain
VSANDLPEWIHRHRREVGGRLRTVRLSRDLTQEQLAEQVGVDSKTISRAENGRYAISVDLVARLAHALSVPSWRFFRD